MARMLSVLVLLAVTAAAAVAIAQARGDGENDQAGARGSTVADSELASYPRLVATEAVVFPGPAAVSAAARWLERRDGSAGFAVVDDRGGIAGVAPSREFESVSLTKAMMLVAFLRTRGADGVKPTAGELESLGYMIRLSDNASADSIYARISDDALRRLARDAGMKRFSIAGDWANATVTPADQARLFAALDRLTPARYRSLARTLLGTVSAAHSWGIPRAGRPRWRVLFKGGWRPEVDGAVVHQAARLERGGRTIAIAVMTEQNIDERYGHRTIQGVARRLLAEPRTPAGRTAAGRLAPLGKLAGGGARPTPRLVPLRRIARK